MADNVAQSIKDLQKDLAALDKQLLSNNANWDKLGQTIVDSMKRGGLGLDDLFSKMKGQKDVLKLRAIIDRDALMDDVKKLQTAVDKGLKSVKVGGVEIIGQKQIEQALEGYKAQLKLVPKTLAEAYDYAVKIANTLGGKKTSGTPLGNARATEMNKVRTTMEEINKQIDRRTQLEKTLSDLQARNGKSATFEGQRMTAKQLNDEIGNINQSIERYKRTLASLGGRGLQALGALGGDGSKTAIKDQMAAMRELYNLTRQYRQMQESKRSGKIVNEQDLIDTRNRLREILNQMKQIEKEHPGSRKTAAARLETERLRDRWREVNREIKPAKSSLESLLPTLRRLASAFGVAFSVQGLVQFGKKLVETRGEFELQQVALRSILQNKQLADEIWDKTMQAALQSPFTAMQLTKYTKQLAAYRIETDKLFNTTKRLADVSAGLGVDMQRLILAYGQVKAANYLRASEIRQFTEAGVNILGELSAYLTEVKGQAVTTAQVMDMVQKRMIRFEDVEEIFKRLTNEGGVFYNMQYVQSQTVKGQINKLHDAYDQMLNSIGKSNEGVLKGTVSLMLNIVQNWREWKTILDSIAFPAITVALIQFGKGLFAANAATIATDKSFKFLTRSGAKLNVQLKALGATLKAHPLFLIASIVFTAGAALVNHAKAVNAVNKEYDELNGRLLETQHKMSSYVDKIKQNNDTIKDSSKSQKEHNEAQKDNARMLGELKRDYPDVANGMSIANNGIISMTNSMKEYNAQLRLQIQLNERAKASFLNQSLKKDAQQFDESINKQQSNLAEYTTKAERAYKKIENFLASGKKGTLSDEELRDAMQKLQRMAAATSVEEYEKAYVEYATTKVNAGRQGLVSLSKALGSGFGFKSISGDRTLQSDREEIRDEIKDDYIYFGRYLREIALLSEDWNGQFALSTEEFISKNKDLLQNMLYTVKKDGTKEIGELGFAISEAFMDAASVSMTEQGQQEIIDELINQFKEKYGLDVAFGVRTKQSERLSDGGAEDKVLTLWRNRIKLIEEMNKKYKDLSKSVYGYTKSEQKVRGEYGLAWLAASMPFEMNEIDFTTDEGVADALAKFRTLIPQKLFAELEKEISGRKATIELDAQVRIREDFGRQMEEAFGNYELTLELQKLNLPKGVAADMWGIEETDLQDLRAKLTEMYNGLRDENGQLYTDAFKDYEKFLNKIDDLERKQQRERLKDYAKYLETQYSDRVKIEMEYIQKLSRLEAETAIPEAQKSAIREGLRREFDEKSRKQDWEDFKGSEFYVEMMEDLEKQGTASLEVMRKKLLEMRDNAENLSPRALKEVVNALEKIDEIERKRTKPLQRVRDAQRALEGVNMKEVYKELAINQEQLALSEEEERSMERAIMLIQKRNEFEEQGYTIEEARVRLSQANQARDFAQSAFDSFKSDGTKEAQDNLAVLEQVLNSAKADVEKWQEIVNILSGQAIIDEQSKGNKYTTFDLGDLQERRKNLKQSIKDLEGVIGKEEELAKLNKELNDAWDATYEAIKGWASSVQNVFDGVMDNVDYFSDSTYGMVTAWKEFGDTSVSALTDLVGGIQAYRKANAEAEKNPNAATGLFTANGLQLALVVLSVLMKIVQAIAKQHDAALDKQIQVQQERIDALKDAYARLEKQIEKTWSSVTYMQAYEQQVQNIREQISAMEAQMAAEREKKNTDDNAVRQYKRDIQDAYDQLDELEQKSIEVFGGIGEEGYRSAAEGFVDAWKSAFLETGDGLQGLQDHFDEFLQEWFVKQATMRIAGNMLQPMFEMIDKAVDPSSNGGVAVTMHELEALRDWAGTNFPIISDTLEDLAGMFGVGGEGSLSGLAAGIQGMTEEQANILEAYWNSVRMYTASIDVNVSRIADMLGAGGGIETNPMLAQMRLIAQNTNNISTLLNAAVVKGVHPYGDAFKVVIN